MKFLFLADCVVFRGSSIPNIHSHVKVKSIYMANMALVSQNAQFLAVSAKLIWQGK